MVNRSWLYSLREKTMSEFESQLMKLATEFGLSVTAFRRPGMTSDTLDVVPWPDSPYWLRVENSPDLESISLRSIVTTTGIAGDRTDIHNIASAIWAIHLQCTGVTSLAITNELSFSGETDARIINLAPFE